MSACSGIRILEIAEGFTAATLCGQLCVGLGAQVTKWESAGGDMLRKGTPRSADGTATLFHLVNAGKKFIAAPEDESAKRALLTRLIEESDVVIAGEVLPTLPEVIEPTKFCQQWPDKVLCCISTFGAMSSKKEWAGNELVAEAMAGLIACTGYPEKPPVCSGVPYATHVTALFAFAGIMAAAWDKQQCGRGQWLDIAVVDCLITLLGNFIPSYFLSGRSPKRVGNRHTTAAPWNLYETKDSYAVICTGSGTGWWQKITKVIGRPDLKDDSRFQTDMTRVAHVEDVDRILSEWTREHSTKHVVDQMIAGGIPASEVSTVGDVLSDPHYRQTRAMVGEAWVEMGEHRIPIPTVGLPLKIGSWDSKTPPRPAPNGSRHTTVPRANVQGKSVLEGIRVLEFGARTSVPLAGRLLADLGAEVIKIEPRKGEGQRNAGQMIGGSSYLFHINNAGKQSIVINPTDPRGRELILQLVTKADIWIENLAPGTVDSMGLSYDELAAVNPNIIYASCSGFGRKSNYGKKRALDAVVQAASGIMSLTGYADHLPVKIGFSAVDLAVAVGLLGALIGALRTRGHTGGGMYVDLAMADIGVWMTQKAWAQVIAGGKPASRLGNRSSTECPHNLFMVKDGFVAISVDTDLQWKRFRQLWQDNDLMRAPELETVCGRLRDVDRLEQKISAWASGKSASEVVAACQAIGIPAAPVRDLADIVKDEDVLKRRLIVDVDHPIAGKMKLLGNPLRFSRTPASVSSGAPVLGAHTIEILQRWLGLSEGQVLTLISDGIVMSAAERTESAGVTGQ